MKKEKVILLNSGKCAWGKCIFCGWGKIEHDVNIERLKKYIDKHLEKGIETLKIFSSGSFLDDKQFPREFRRYLVKKCKELVIKNLIIESRPEFITEENLEDFKTSTLRLQLVWK